MITQVMLTYLENANITNMLWLKVQKGFGMLLKVMDKFSVSSTHVHCHEAILSEMKFH